MALDATDGRKPFSPGIYLVLPDILLACIVAANPNKSWRLAFSVAFTILTIHALSYTTGDKLQDYSTGSTLSGQVLTACYLLLFTKLVDDFQYISDSRPLASLSFWKRIYWAACIIHSPRGIGWNYQVRRLTSPLYATLKERTHRLHICPHRRQCPDCASSPRVYGVPSAAFS